MRNTAKVLAFIASLSPFAAFGQSAPATLGYHTLYGRIGAVPGDVGPGQGIPWSTILSKGILDGVGTAQGTIPCRGASVWGPLVPGATGTLLASAGTTVCPGWISTVPVANGGTGASTAAGARASTGLNIDQYTAHNDSNYSILSTDRTVGTNTTLTAARTWTLPAASSVNPGQTITVADYGSAVNGLNSLTIQRAGSDTIIAGSSVTSVVIATAGGRYDFRSDGVSKWSAAAIGGSSTTQKTPLDYGAVCDGTTNDSTALQNWLNAISGTYTGFIPSGLTCVHSGSLYVKSNTTIYGYGATIKAANASNSSTTGIHLTDATWAALGPSNIAIYGLTYDGNRANRTPPGQAAGIYIINAINVRLQDVTAKNCVSDCLYAGGTSAIGLSQRIVWNHVLGTNAYRNSGTIAGVDRMQIIASEFDNANGTSPQAGLDAEPNNTTDTNNNWFISNSVFEGNAGNGLNVICAVAGQCNINGGASMVTASGNGGFGFSAGATSTNFRWCGVLGSGNTSGLTSTVTDKCPP